MQRQNATDKLNPSALIFLREKFGDEVAVRFIERFSGQEFCIRTPSSRTHSRKGKEIINAFGPDMLDTIFKEYKGVPFIVPVARKFRYEFYAKQGLGSSAIAPLIGVSVRQSYCIGRQYKKRRAAKFQQWKREAER